MHHANHFYGHAHILARYCGLPDPPRIWGYLQHGWNILDGFAAGMKPDYPGLPRYVWSEPVRRRAWSLGHRHVMAMGAAWLYLLDLERVDRPEPRLGTIWYPFHGWEGQEVIGSHDRLIAQIQEVETEPVTMCLYWNDFDNASLRRKYERAGFRVITHGNRGLYHQGTDAQFLYRQLRELRRHRRVASNRLSSAVFYGISVGCEGAVYGEPMVLAEENAIYGGQSRIRALWPHMHGERLDPSAAAETTLVELGVAQMITPVEMIDIFRWATRGT